MTAWWGWALVAVLLAVVEVLVPSYLALGFAIGAGIVALGLLTGVLSAVVGVTGGFATGILMILFAALSLGAWLALRRVFGVQGEQGQTFEDDVND